MEIRGTTAIGGRKCGGEASGGSEKNVGRRDCVLCSWTLRWTGRVSAL